MVDRAPIRSLLLIGQQRNSSRLLHFFGQGDWSDRQVLAKVGEMVLPEIERRAIEPWIIDDTDAFPRRDGIRLGLHGNTGKRFAATLWTQLELCGIATAIRRCRRPG